MSFNQQLQSLKFGTLVSETEAAALLGVELSTMRNYRAPSVARTQKRGIRWTQIGRSTWYVLADIVAAAERNMREAFVV